MFKQIIFIIALLSSLSIATEVSTNFELKTTYANGAVDVLIDYHRDADREIRDKSKDWVAVYKKGTSTAWQNVINWAWVKDLSGQAPGDYYGHIFRGTHIAKPGEYEVRFFKNNSFIVDKSLSFTTKQVPSFLTFIKKAGYDAILMRGFDSHEFVPAPRDWVGIYKENDDNTWQNVIQWGWLKDLKKYGTYRLTLNKDLYQKGVKYKARYFLNNSFHTYKETEAFYVGELPDNEKKVVSFAFIEKRDGALFSRAGVYSNYIKSPNDWIGIFKNDVEFTDVSNLIAWAYVSKVNSSKTLEILKPELIESKKDYKAVFFRNNSYEKFGKAFTFKSRY